MRKKKNPFAPEGEEPPAPRPPCPNGKHHWYVYPYDLMGVVRCRNCDTTTEIWTAFNELLEALYLQRGR